MARDDAVELRERFSFAEREIGLDPSLGRHRLDRDVVALAHE